MATHSLACSALASHHLLACCAGVKNIHAYSWLAHARKYLESIAREKKHASARKKFSSRASGNWDHHSNLVDHVDRCCSYLTPSKRH